MLDFNIVKENYNKVTKELASLTDRRVEIMAVTKNQPVEAINYAINELGISIIGENRVQELLSKYDNINFPADRKVRIHLIGSLQTNKVKYIIDKVDMIESLDSLKLAKEIDLRAQKAGKVMEVLVELNIGREPQKGGVIPEDLVDFLEKLSVFKSIKVRGLMTIAPKCDENDKFFKYFSETYQYFIDICEKNIHNISMDILSMGMSSSYAQAVMAGSTRIRLGTTLFGERNL
ncbi:MAG: YggS family pyridoxal phosphate-dependent enzyme [Ruminococcaceae bacterium]|nr:YggS family pyridoxal phosphate-dependent enzyme [Oscillospiraceae bacterium]